MVVIEVNAKELSRLLGERVSPDTLEKEIPMLGLAWDGREGDNIRVEVEPNRPDLLSIEGLARALKGRLGIEKGLPRYKTGKSEVTVEIDPKVDGVRPVIACGVVRNVEIDGEAIRSIMQIQEKLHVTHGRKRKKVAIGIHDLDRVSPPFKYTAVKPEEYEFVPLDMNEKKSLKQILEEHPKGREYAWTLESHDKYPLIIDSNGEVLSFPPIINGELTRVTPDTRNLFIDVTGTDERAVNTALAIVVTMLAERGGRIETVKMKKGRKTWDTPDLSPREFVLDPGYARRILGMDLSEKEIMECLEKMRHGTRREGKNIVVLVPPYRADVMHAYDLIEDIAIGYGYDRIEPEIPKISTIGGEDWETLFVDKTRELMIGLGCQEVHTWLLSNPRDEYERMNIQPERVEGIVELLNPLTTEFTIVRNWILPSLMRVLERNTHEEYPQAIFEADTCAMADRKSPTGAREWKSLGFLEASRETTFTTAKSTLEALLKALGVEAEYYIPQEDWRLGAFIPGRVAGVKIGERKAGIVGEIHPKVLEEHGIEMPVAGFEIDLGVLAEEKNRSA